MGQRIAHPERRAEGVAAHPQMRNVAQKFQRMSLFLQGVSRGVRRAVKMNGGDFELHRLALRGRFDQCAGRRDAAAGGDLPQHLFGHRARVDDKLHALEARSVVELDESDALGVAPRAHPTAQDDFAADR